jgi:zinc transport system permease protein
MRLTFLLAALGGAVAGVGGYLLAFFKELPVGASQTVVAAALVPAALAVRGGMSLFRQGLRARA